MEKIIEGLINVVVNIISTGLLFVIGYLCWRFIKPAVKIHDSISEEIIPKYNLVDGAVKSSIKCTEEGICYSFKIVNTSKVFEAKNFHIRLLPGKIEKDKDNKESTRYVEVDITYKALEKLGILKSNSIKRVNKKTKSDSTYFIVTTKPLRKILEIYDNLLLIVRYTNTINKEFIIKKYFTVNDIFYGQFSYDDDLTKKPT